MATRNKQCIKLSIIYCKSRHVYTFDFFRHLPSFCLYKLSVLFAVQLQIYDLTLLPSGSFHPVPLPSHPLSYSAPPPPEWWEIQSANIRVGSVVSPTIVIVNIYSKETKKSLRLRDVERLY